VRGVVGWGGDRLALEAATRHVTVKMRRTPFTCATKLIEPVRSPPIDHVAEEQRQGASITPPTKAGRSILTLLQPNDEMTVNLRERWEPPRRPRALFAGRTEASAWQITPL
jgi:hypothetical protein